MAGEEYSAAGKTCFVLRILFVFLRFKSTKMLFKIGRLPYLLFLFKPASGSLPALRTHSLNSVCQLAPLQSSEDVESSPRYNVSDNRVDLGDVCI